MVIVCNLHKFRLGGEKESLLCNHVRLFFNNNTVHSTLLFYLFRLS